MKKKLRGKTAVITGASSGIGKAIALTLAEKGMNLVLAARREDALQKVVSECESLGAAAMAVKTDVANYTDVENLIGKAKTFFGDIDVWINNAGVMAIGGFTETPVDVHEQVIKTNLLGPLYGAYAILPYFKQRGHGTIINTVSLGAYVPNPFGASYAAGKFGLRGLFEAVRGELGNYPNIHICNVHPSFIDTPGPVHAANYTGKKLKPAPPLYDPFQVAHAVKKLILKPRPSVMVGGQGRVARLIHAIAPNSMEKSLGKIGRAYFKFAKSVPITQGNVFYPVNEGTNARGGNMRRPSILRFFYKMRFPKTA